MSRIEIYKTRRNIKKALAEADLETLIIIWGSVAIKCCVYYEPFYLS